MNEQLKDDLAKDYEELHSGILDFERMYPLLKELDGFLRERGALILAVKKIDPDLSTDLRIGINPYHRKEYIARLSEKHGNIQPAFSTDRDEFPAGKEAVQP
jgi:hypothetical protein